MNIGAQLQKLRKERGLSQEAIAEMLGVSRQSVSKWEQDAAYPETEKLIKLAAFYNVTLDSMINPNHQKSEGFLRRKFHYEYKSKRSLFGLPVIHVNVGFGLYTSKGIISIGNISFGLISIGYLSVGLLSVGLASFGLISLGVFAVALLVALGSIAVGTVAIGAIAIGLFSIGAVSVGYFSVGALSVAKYVAIGDHANGWIAIGKTKVTGTYTFMEPYNKEEIYQLIETEVPSVWQMFITWIKSFIF